MSLLEDVTLAIGRAAGYESKPVIRKAFEKQARAAIEAVRMNLAARLVHDEEGVIETLEGGKGPLE